MQDPTYLEMYRTLCREWRGLVDPRERRYDFAEAIYWFCEAWHGGGGSNMYRALSCSPYQPGPWEDGPEDPMYLETLEAVYANA